MDRETVEGVKKVIVKACNSNNCGDQYAINKLRNYIHDVDDGLIGLIDELENIDSSNPHLFNMRKHFEKMHEMLRETETGEYI